MKKKTLLITLLFLCIFSLVGCTKKREAEDPKNIKTELGKYTAIYTLNGTEIKIVHNDDMIYLKIIYGDEIFDNVNGILEDNRMEIDLFNIDFYDDYLKLEVLSEDLNGIKGGEYKKTNTYTVDEIFKDYIGEDSILSANLTGKYVNGDDTFYILEKNNGEMRVGYKSDKEQIDLILDKEKDNVYQTSLGNDHNIFTFSGNTLEVDMLSFGNKSELNGKYTKTSDKLTKLEIIKLFIS